jgi:HSP20 family protein
MRVTALTPTIGKVKDDIDKVFDRFFAPAFFGETTFAPWFPPEKAEFGAFVPALDMMETPKEYVIRCELPGIHKENLDINLTGNVLKITGRRDEVHEGAGETYLWKEREAGKFVRTLRLPTAVEEGKVEATYQDGILTVKLPKVAAALPSKILVK